MASSNPELERLHLIMFPLLAPGHMIPIIDMAKLIAKHSCAVTIITTPHNAVRFKPTIDRAAEAGLDIRLCQLQFPSSDIGLPEGCENIDMLPSLGLAYNFISVLNKLQQPMENLLQELEPKPSCIISDMGFHWTNEVAKKFNIPRIVFHGTSCMSLLCLHNLESTNFLRNIESETEPFVIPDLPDRLEITKGKLPNSVKLTLGELFDARLRMRQAESESFGVVVNSFKELEPEYLERFKMAKGKSIWCVGPVSVSHQDNFDKGDRGNKAAIDGDECLKWLDLQDSCSVIYACLGSLCNLAASQITELATGLEQCDRPFILALRGGYDLKELNRLEERMKGRGLVIRGWAPQLLILSHPAVGAFLTHCGWNSTIEGLSAGLPMVTFPLFAEQFLNELHVVRLLKVGVSVRDPENKQDEGHTHISGVSKENVKKAVEMVMNEGIEGNKMRERAQMYGVLARKAVEEGGSSEMDLRLMIQELLHQITTQRLI